jgi:DNA-binding NarL/FixJ family response regulator
MTTLSNGISVAVVEDTSHFADLLEALIQGTYGFIWVGKYPSAEAAMAQLPVQMPQVAIIDVHLPGETGLSLIRQLKPKMPQTQFMVFTIFEDPEVIFEALEAGATGYLIKSTSPVKILEAITEIAQGGSPMSGNIARTIISKFQPQPNLLLNLLTEREKEILDWMAKGYRYKEIADRLFISMDTVRSHVRHIYEKLEVQSKTEAINKVFPR